MEYSVAVVCRRDRLAAEFIRRSPARVRRIAVGDGEIYKNPALDVATTIYGSVPHRLGCDIACGRNLEKENRDCCTVCKLACRYQQ